MAARNLTLIVGVDACKGGWIAVTFTRDTSSQAGVKVCKSIANLVSRLLPDSIIAVDMPIGLPDRTIKGGREPDWLARAFLGPRQTSVFPVPSRCAVYAREAVHFDRQDYERVCTVARETSDPPKAPSIQAYSIFPRIRQIDGILRQGEALRRRVFEVHPEVSFTVMNGDKPISVPKKVKAGMCLRKNLLARQGFAACFLDAPPQGAALDDFYDACACAWSGNRIAGGEARVFPTHPATDAEGLQVAIWA